MRDQRAGAGGRQRGPLSRALAPLLEAAGVGEPKRVRLVARGGHGQVWELTLAGGERLALKVFGRADHDPGPEAELAAHLHAHGLPVPRPLRSGRRPRPFLLSEWIGGRGVFDTGATPGELRALGAQAALLQRRLHRVPPPASPAPALAWVERAGHPELVARVQAVAVEDALAHLDFHPLNLRVRAGRIVGLLDLALAARADRRADLGTTRALLAVGARSGLVADVPPAAWEAFAAGWRAAPGEAREDGHAELFEAWGATCLARRLRPVLADTRPDVLAGLEREAALRRERLGLG